MGKGWELAKSILGLHTCSRMANYPQLDEQIPSDCNGAAGAGTLVHHPAYNSGSPSRSPSLIPAFRSTIQLARSSCAICLETMKPGHGYALFTAECSHTFHFSCIAANVRHGNFICPVCRAKWKDVPWQAPDPPVDQSTRRSDNSESRRELRIPQRRSDSVLRILHHATTSDQSITPSDSDPFCFDDDEPLLAENSVEAFPDTDYIPEGGSSDEMRENAAMHLTRHGTLPQDRESGGIFEQSQIKVDEKIKLTAFAEVSAVAFSETRDDFTVLVHLNAPARMAVSDENVSSQNPGRVPIDLVTVLDVSGSMAGAKLRLLKRAMNFVISNLSADDRLSIVAFSSTASRLLPLRRMVEEGKQSALRAIDGLISAGGTNIAEGLRKGAKALEDRRMRNPVASIILLSDGQDMYDMMQNQAFAHLRGRLNRQRPLPPSLRHYLTQAQASFPVHAFGFGADHDAITMHAIAEHSGGTFSFIQAEETVQDAFAQCIGGLLSVVVQDVQLLLSCGTETIRLSKLEAGSYETSIDESGDGGIVKFRDMYADEERDVLVELKLPAMNRHSEMVVLKVDCFFKDPISKSSRRISMPELCISRPEAGLEQNPSFSPEVSSQRNRLLAAKSIAKAGAMADRGDIAGAQQALNNAKVAIHHSTAWQAGDPLSKLLEAELTEIQARMANRPLYERSGRAYILSAHSSHFRQRATTRGDHNSAVDRHSRDYQTPSMVDMVYRSQTQYSHASSPRARHHPVQESTAKSTPDITS